MSLVVYMELVQLPIPVLVTLVIQVQHVKLQIVHQSVSMEHVHFLIVVYVKLDFMALFVINQLKRL